MRRDCRITRILLLGRIKASETQHGGKSKTPLGLVATSTEKLGRTRKEGVGDS
jgi:hypothetical protein